MRLAPSLPVLRGAALALLVAGPVASACVTPQPTLQRAGVIDFLYPQGVPPAPASDVHLALPLRVGVMVAPGTEIRPSTPDMWFGQTYSPVFDPAERLELVERVFTAFQGTPGVASIEVIPDHYLRPGGGFENADLLRAFFGIDLLVVLSYDQTQHQDYNASSLTYWTLVGAFVVPGNRNETHTFVDISVFDIPSRSHLFHAGGLSRVEHISSAAENVRGLREFSARGFEAAVDEAILELDAALAAFREQAKTGTVRGPGTPNLVVSGEGAGALDPLDLVVLVLVAGLALRRSRAG